MWFSTLLLILIFVVGFLVAAIFRIKWSARRGLRRSVSEDAVASPVSRAVTEVIAIAGGIYLSLEMATSFLHLELPGGMSVLGVSLDPLAMLSLTIALLQPVVMMVISR